jgi:hypothetical protein
VIVVPETDWARYAKDHVIVLVRTVAYRLPRAGHKPEYSFVEDFGGVVQAFPLEMVQASGELPLVLDIANGSEDTLRVKILTDLHVPPGAPAVGVKLPSEVLTLEPGSTTTVNGTVVNPEAESGCNGLPSFCCMFKKSDALTLGTGVVLVGLVGVGVRRRRAQ